MGEFKLLPPRCCAGPFAVSQNCEMLYLQLPKLPLKTESLHALERRLQKGCPGVAHKTGARNA
eukprot:2734534-Amphidinium_carterae.1